MKDVYKYCEDILNRRILSCIHVQKAVLRFNDDLKRNDLYFDVKKAERCFAWFELFKHYTGKHNGKPFVLSAWQKFIIANIVGWYYVDSDKRRFTSSYIEVARKQGKTALASVLCLYFLLADGEEGAQVLLSANSKEQASIAFSMCRAFVKQIDPKKKRVQDYRDNLKVDKTNSELRVLASDFKTLDGFNASFGLVDEYHSAPDTMVRDVIKSSQGMRENPHLCTITTAGFNKYGPCYMLRSTALEILHGIKRDDNFFCIVFCPDDDDEFTDKKTWIKSNPNLGVTVSESYLLSQITTAINTPSEAVGVKTKNLNMWCSAVSVWLTETAVAKVMQRVLLNNFDADNTLVYVGVDLASVADLTAVSFLIVENGILYFTTKYYLPQTCLQGKENSFLYENWSRDGLLTLTAGNVTDYDYITRDILAVAKNFTIVSVSYDPYNATQWAINATNEGLNLQEYSQSIGNFNKPTREIERLILEGDNIIIDSNSITAFCFNNVVMKEDHNGNIKPSKTNGKNKIDGVISMIMAMGGYLLDPPMQEHDYTL